MSNLALSSRFALRLLSLTVLFILITTSVSAQLIISEFRLRGPNGANDEFIELYNNSASPLTVTASTGTGFGVAASDGVLRCTVPNATVIPARGHFLCANSVGFSYASYPEDSATTSAADATYATDIPDNAGIALFNTNIPANFAVGTRLDAVGSASEANALYKEGTGYPDLTPFSIDYAFVRDACGKGGSITTPGACSQGGLSKDTGDNATDFIFVDTNGTSAGAGQRLGAPGPENLSAPVSNTSTIADAALDNCSSSFAVPNYVRDFTSVPALNSTFGTIDIRRTFTNNTGGALTRLRFRVVDLTTFPAPSGFSDLRPRDGSDVVVTVDRTPCGSGTSNITVFGTTLEQDNTAPSTGQPNGGGFNSSMSVPGITAGTPLANGASIDVHFLLGIQQTGTLRFGIVAEGLPKGGGLFLYECNTEGCVTFPTVTSIVRADPDPTAAASVNFTVTFSAAVTGVDVTDFALTTTGTIAGAAVTGVTGSGTTRTVTVSTGTGDGTIRLDVADDDTIIDVSSNPLGGVGAGNGNFTTGQFYTVSKPPTVLSIARVEPSPTIANPVHFTVTFSESVTGVDAGDFTLTTTGTIAGAAVTGVTGSGFTRTVTVGSYTGFGTIRLDVTDNDTIVDLAANPLGGPGAGNGNFTTGEVFTITNPALIPMLDPRALMLLAIALATVAVAVMRRM